MTTFAAHVAPLTDIVPAPVRVTITRSIAIDLLEQVVRDFGQSHVANACIYRADQEGNASCIIGGVLRLILGVDLFTEWSQGRNGDGIEGVHDSVPGYVFTEQAVALFKITQGIQDGNILASGHYSEDNGKVPWGEAVSVARRVIASIFGELYLDKNADER